MMDPVEEDDGEKIESTASITSAIMLKIPAENMSVLREDFLACRGGLDLPDFLVAVLSAMHLGDAESLEMLLMVADLIDFFHLVDINGDAYMEWEEFVMFILDAVVKEPEEVKAERFIFTETRLVQSAAVRDSIVSAVMVPALGKVVMGVGPGVQMFGADDKVKPSNTHLAHEFPIKGAVVNGPKPPGGRHLTIVHMQYLPGQDILAVLRSDMYIEFFKFLSRSNYSAETIESLGKIAMNKPCHKIVFRVSAHRKPRLLVIGTSPVIDSFLFTPMGSNGLASLSDRQTMEMHTDYVRDVITIDEGPSRFIVSASLDKSVIFWDLDSSEFRFRRTGHTAGVESLAFGGKSLLFAGGYDYSILVWDITAAINKPLFQLKGAHLSSVVRIVGLENIDRCASLDEAGILVWWDISRNILGDTRVIDTVTCPEDHAHSFDVIADLPHFFETLHGVIFMVAGRRQHIFKLKDVSKHEAAPVCVLYSATLLSVFTVHSHEIIFWNVVSGDVHKVIKELVSEHVKITCATLDDRGRRIIIGDTSGTIRYYNCLNGHQIKTLDSIGVPIKELIYSPDKNLMIITENSDILIIDDSLDNTLPGVDYALRSVHFTSGGSLADITCVAYSADLGLIATVDALGLLIIWDYLFATPEFMIANVSGNASDVGQIQFIGDFPMLLIADNSKNFSVLTFETQSGSNKKRQLWRLESVLPVREEGEEEEEEEGGMHIGARARPYNDTKAKKYLAQEGEVRRLAVHVQTLEEVQEQEEASSAVISRAPSSHVSDSFSVQPKIVQSTYPKNVEVRVVCGFDDGTMSITDITEALRKVDVGRYLAEDHVSERLNCNAKGRCVKYIGESDCRKILPTEQVKAMEKFSTCPVECIKDCHRAPISCVRLVGGFQCILTASEDKCVMLWDIDGSYLGLLTRGSEMDKMFRKHWYNPEDMVTRKRLRVANATAAVNELGLAALVHQRMQQHSEKANGGGLTGLTKLVRARGRAANHNAVLTDPRDLARALENEALGGSGLLPVTTDTIAQSLRVVEKFPDRSRLLCQFEGKITYEPSKKDIARLQLQSSVSAPQIGHVALEATGDTTKPHRKRKKKKKKAKARTSFSEGGTTADQKYLKTIHIADECLAQNSQDRNKGTAPAKVDRWHYANEIAAIDAQDPGNWEISSLNRLRDMYQNMHREMAKCGKLSNDQEKILMQKLRALCPGGDVPGYFEKLKATIRDRKRRKGGSREVRASGEYGVFDVQDGQLVSVSVSGGVERSHDLEDGEEQAGFRTSDYDEEFVPKQGLLADEDVDGVKATVGVVSLSQLLANNDVDNMSEGSGVSSQSDFSEGKLAREVEHENARLEELKQHGLGMGGGTTNTGSGKAPLLLQARQSGMQKRLSAKSITAATPTATEPPPAALWQPLITPSSSSRSLKSQHETTPSSPKSKSATLLDPPDFLARQRTTNAVNNFERKMRLTEKQAKKASRQTRKKVRLSKKNISANTAALMDSVRFLSDPLEQTERLSTDFVNEHIEAKWGQRARALLLNSGPKVKAASTGPKKAPCLHEIRRMLTRTSSSIADTYQEQMRREEQLLERKSFGPYVTSELLQVFELFKSFPKQNPTPADTVLMAGNAPEKEMGNGLTTNPVYGCIDLADLVKHRWMRNRPHFKSFLDKVVLINRPDMSAGLFITLNRIIMQICPLLTPKDRGELAEFFKVYRGPASTKEVTISSSHRAQLKKIFDLFDVNHSGTIDGPEVRAVLDSAYLTRITADDSLVGKEEDVEKAIDDASIGSILSEAHTQKSIESSSTTHVMETVREEGGGDDRESEKPFDFDDGEEGGPAEIDFPSFLEMFGKLLFPSNADEETSS